MSKFHVVKHRAALPWREAPPFMAQLAAETSMAAQCLQFLMLTAVRSAEARGCRWDEIDMVARTWMLPAKRMKAGRVHRVALSEPALAILREAAEVSTGELVFFGQTDGRAVSDVGLLGVVKRLAHPSLTVHGFRSSFADWCADHGYASDLVEAALAHVSGSAVRRAYARSDLLDARRPLMDAWAAFLTKPAAVVVPFPTAAA
jgi:integrase